MALSCLCASTAPLLALTPPPRAVPRPARRVALGWLSAAAFSQQRPAAALASSTGGGDARQGSSRLSFWGGSRSEPDENNVFARILRGDAPASVVDGNDKELFTFRDRNPASTVHLLVIPRRFVRDASMLQPDDAGLVQRMEDKARALVRAEVGEANFDEDELTLGFHWPPFYSVPWLHLHAIYPRRAIKIRRSYKYTRLSFKSPEWVLGRLEGRVWF